MGNRELVALEVSRSIREGGTIAKAEGTGVLPVLLRFGTRISHGPGVSPRHFASSPHRGLAGGGRGAWARLRAYSAAAGDVFGPAFRKGCGFPYTRDRQAHSKGP